MGGRRRKPRATVTWAQGIAATAIGFGLGTATAGCIAIADHVTSKPARARNATATEPTQGSDDTEAADETGPPSPPPISNAIVRTDPPDEWLTRRRYANCHRYRGRRYCNGPLKVAKPHGKAKKRAERLGLGTRKTASHLLVAPPEDEWVEAVDGREADSLRWPVDGGTFWRGFGRGRRAGKGRLHKGVDVGCDPGTPVVAVNDGLVAYSHYQLRGYGIVVIVVHADGTTSLYAHLKSAYVFPGERVRRGEVIAKSGHTGLARGPHLHFEWRRGGRPRDPMPRFEALPEEVATRMERVRERRGG